MLLQDGKISLTRPIIRPKIPCRRDSNLKKNDSGLSFEPRGHSSFPTYSGEITNGEEDRYLTTVGICGPLPIFAAVSIAFFEDPFFIC